jgi:D-beta-D-heptose 7-phosphate kinase/D-beta-D-heptose 1-phosphate adenosyltransferase
LSSSKKILSWPALLRRLAHERRRRKKIVFTNGCFDLIHAGHLRVLESCKKHGDVLVLGLNSDSSTRWLKGPKRPILTQGERAALLAGFSVVDYVTIFNEPTPEKLINLVKPDVLVKGGDWKPGEIVGANVAKKVVRVPLVKGKSTTAIIAMIAERYGRK